MPIRNAVPALAGFLLVLIAVPAPAAAQTTGTPVFLAPYHAFRAHEWGGYFSDPGSGFTLEGSYRWGRGTSDVGIRLGVGDSNNGGGPFFQGRSDTYFLGGVDFRQRVIRNSEGFPLDGALTVGLGGQFGDGFSTGFIPIGLSLGREVDLEGTETSFVPYFHPVFVPTFGDGSDDVLFTIGLGVDIRFTRSFELRVAGALGDYDGISLGIAVLR